jgi:hypothetical protein
MRSRTSGIAWAVVVVLASAYLGCGGTTSSDGNTEVGDGGAADAAPRLDATVDAASGDAGADVTAIDATTADATSPDAADAENADGEPADDVDAGEDGGEAGPDASNEAGSSEAGAPDASNGGVLAQARTLTMDSFSVPPHSEVYMCQPFGHPFAGDAEIVKVDGYESAGSKMFLFTMSPATGMSTAGPIQDCTQNGLEHYPFVYLSQTPGHFIQTFPQPSMGYPLGDSDGLMLFAHVLNTSDQTITPTVAVNVYSAAPGVVTQEVGHILLQNTALTVHAQGDAGSQTYADTWTPSGELPASYSLLASWSFMHYPGTDVKASTGGTALYETTQYAAPTPVAHSPAIVMSGSQSISWQCTYPDTGTTDMAFGPSFNQPMCAYIGTYTSPAAHNPDVIVWP